MLKVILIILYLKFKLSKWKATFVPREQEIYRWITAFILVFYCIEEFAVITLINQRVLICSSIEVTDMIYYSEGSKSSTHYA